MIANKFFLFISALLAGCAIFIFVSSTLISPDFIYPQRIDSTFIAYRAMETGAPEEPIPLTPADEGLAFRDMNVVAIDGITLKGWYVAAKDSPANTIIIIPDLNQSKLLFIDHLKQYHDRGWNAVVVDMRAHGESEGSVYTPGMRAVEDVRTIIDSIIRIDTSGKIVLHGVGLGAAIAMQVAVYDERPLAYVLENPISSLETYLDRYSFKRWGRMRWLWKPLFYREVESLLAYKIRDLDLSKIAGYIDNPMLFLTGNQNNVVFTSEVLRVYSASKAVKKDLFLVKGAGQNDMALIGGERYYNKIVTFLLNALPKKTKKTKYKKLAMQ